MDKVIQLDGDCCLGAGVFSGTGDCLWVRYWLSSSLSSCLMIGSSVLRNSRILPKIKAAINARMSSGQFVFKNATMMNDQVKFDLKKSVDLILICFGTDKK